MFIHPFRRFVISTVTFMPPFSTSETHMLAAFIAGYLPLAAASRSSKYRVTIRSRTSFKFLIRADIYIL